MKQSWVYIFCKTSSENKIANYIKMAFDDIETAVPMRIRRKTIRGNAIEDLVNILPGYVFFRTKDDQYVPQLEYVPNVFKLLEYDNRSWKLLGRDAVFAEFLFENNALMEPRVSFINGRLHFEEGFLYGYDDRVLRVNRRKKTAELKLDICEQPFWVGYNEN